MNKVILWDFDGTLGYREGNWEETIFELVDNKKVKTAVNFDLVYKLLQSGFPLHEPKKNFISLRDKNAWWEYVMPIFIEIYTSLGFNKFEAMLKASQIPEQYSKLEKWKVYDDALLNLAKLENLHWRNILVTNNVPDFPIILNQLSLNKYFYTGFVSSLMGCNKPNPLTLNGYLETLAYNTKIIVVGDREESDLMFANAIHAEGILVRSDANNQLVNFSNLNDLTEYLLSLNLE